MTDRPLDLSFVILTWNRAKFLDLCVSRLTENIADTNRCEILIADNGSTDATSSVLDRHAQSPHVTVIRRKRNYGLNTYKMLFRRARGEHIVIVDDDVVEFPKSLDRTFLEYMRAYRDYGFLALNVVQNEFTNGAKPAQQCYTEDKRDGYVVERGPTGGWCTCFRRKDYRKIRLVFGLLNLNMRHGEDYALERLFRWLLHLKSGIIRDARCFHASGPHYSKENGYLERDIEKYRKARLDSFANAYEKFL